MPDILSSETLLNVMSAETTKTRSPNTIVVILAFSGMVVSIMQTILVPLIPDLPKLLGTTTDNASWLITATLLASSVATPSVTRLADMFGKKRMLIICLLGMLVGSLLGALSSSLFLVIVARSLQGFAIALIPVSMSIMRDELPREKLGPAVALMSATFGIGGGIGLPLSGVIYEKLGWHAVFWVSMIMAALLLTAVLVVIEESDIRTGGRFDIIGAVLLSGALLSYLLGVTKGSSWGWISESTLLCFLIASILMATWIPYEFRVSQPLVDLRTTIRRPVLVTNMSSFLIGFAMYCNMLTTTQLLQLPKETGYSFGMTVIGAGVSLLPAAGAMIIFAPVSAGITKKYGPRSTLVVGATVLAVGYFARVYLVSSLWEIIFGSVIVSIGTAIAFASMPVLIMRSVPITETAAANGVNSVVRSAGTASASASVAAILTASTMKLGNFVLPSEVAFKHIFVLAGIAAITAGLVAFGIPTSEATMSDAAAAKLRGLVSDHEKVSFGFVVDSHLVAIPHAVVSVSQLDGSSVDRGFTDSQGKFSVVLPDFGDYLVVTSAPGWNPSSTIARFTDATEAPTFTLSEKLSVNGLVSEDGKKLNNAALTLTEIDGSPFSHGRSEDDGTFRLPLPKQGHYILTAINPESGRTKSVEVAIDHESVNLVIDI